MTLLASILFVSQIGNIGEQPMIVPMSLEAAEAFRATVERQNAAAPQPSDREIVEAMITAETEFASRHDRCAPRSLGNIAVAPATGVAMISDMISTGQMRNGWRVSFDSIGCEREGRVIYTLFQMASGEFAWLRIGSGETEVNASIYIDTMNLARPALVQYFTYNEVDCPDDQIHLPSMRVVSRDENMGYEIFGVYLQGAWTEEWTFPGCGHRAIVPIDYRWDGATGARINMRLHDATFEAESQP